VTWAGRVTPLVVAAGVAALLAAGCASGDQRQATVIEQVKTPGQLTPIQRGVVRDEALRAAEGAMRAFRSGDPAAMRAFFSDQYVKYYDKVRKDDAARGRVRVRRHSNVNIDVTNMDQAGHEVEITYTFTSGSYYADLSGRHLTKASGKHSEIDLVMDKTPKGWIVTRMFSGKEELQ
jgi:hypothetical protein